MAQEDNRTKALNAALSQIDRQFGKGTVMRLGDAPRVVMPSVSTGSLGLDIALGIGGLPFGRVVEIFGPESSGKTTLTLSVIAQAQKQGKVCAFVDAEHALDPPYAGKLGVNIKDLLISQPDCGEQAWCERVRDGVSRDAPERRLTHREPCGFSSMKVSREMCRRRV